MPKFGKKFDAVSLLYNYACHTGKPYMNDCFVSLTLSAPVLSPREGICYLAIPIGYRMWTKERTKPELAGDFIVKMMSLMKSLPLYSNRLWSNLTAGRLNQAGPYAQGHWPCVFCNLWPFIPIA